MMAQMVHEKAQRTMARAIVRVGAVFAVAFLCFCSSPFRLLSCGVAAAAELNTEILYVRGCHDAASPDVRETTECFATASKADSTTPIKSVQLSLQGVGFPTDTHRYRVVLQEYRRPSLLGEQQASPTETPKLERITLLCEKPSPSVLFPSQLMTCELVNPLLTMNASSAWRPHLKRLVDTAMWFDVRLEERRDDTDAYSPVSVLRRAVQLQVTNTSSSADETGEAMLKRQRRAVSWEEVRKHPLERLYGPVGGPANGSASSSSSANEEGSDLFETAESAQSGEEVWVELGIGGLKRELRSLFRRVFLSRLPSLAPLADALQLQHVRGVILYGPPGNGKTLIARNLFRLLGPNTRLSVVNAADILSKFVGESEKNLRDVFEGNDIGTRSKAEDEDTHSTAASKSSGNSKKSAAGSAKTLQVLVIDEFEALFRRRGHSGDESSAKAVYDGVTNTLLSLMDGVKSRNDLLVVGLTNRLQAIDQALLRPGRFEVLIEIPAPDVPGREDIFFIHTDRLREHDFLAADVDLHTLALESGGFSGSDIAGTVRSAVSYALLRYRKEGLFARETDARVDAQADEFGHRPRDIGSGSFGLGDVSAEVREEAEQDGGRGGEASDADNAAAHTTRATSGSPFSASKSLFEVTRADFERAMKDIRSAKDESSALSQLSAEGDGAGTDIVDYDGTVTRDLERATSAMQRVMQSDRTMTGVIAITGAPGTGKSTLARALTRAHDFTTVRYFSCRRLTELRDHEEQLAKLRDALSEASHTERGLVVLDDYDALVDSIGSGGYAATTLRGLLYEYVHRPGGVSRALIADSPLATAEDAGGEAEAGNVVVNAGSRVAAERNRRVLVVTSSLTSMLQPLALDAHLRVHPVLRRGAAALLSEYRVVDPAHAARVAAAYPVSMSYRSFLRVTDMALQWWVQHGGSVNTDSETGEDGAKGLTLPAYFATSEAARTSYEELHAAQQLANFYTVTSSTAAREFVQAVRATVSNMGMMDPYAGWKGEGNEAELEDDDTDEHDELKESVDIDAVVGDADEIFW